MSGGAFNHEEWHIGQIVDHIEHEMINNENEELDEWDCKIGKFYSKETMKEFKKGVDILRKAHIYARRIDYLLSGDDGEESFHRRLKEELDENRQKG